MNATDILQLPSMPLASPSYPRGPYRFVDREYLIVTYNLADIQVKGAWSGPARLQLNAHVNAPVADLPVRKIIGGLHFIADLTLPYGRVIYDYLRVAAQTHAA